MRISRTPRRLTRERLVMFDDDLIHHEIRQEQQIPDEEDEMTCEEARRRSQEAVDSKVPLPRFLMENGDVMAHFQGCPSCRAFIEDAADRALSVLRDESRDLAGR